MRDIRPIKPSGVGSEEPEEMELYEASQEAKAAKPAFTGSSVPVAKIPVPDDIAMVHSDIDHERKQEPQKKAGKVRIGKQERRWVLIFMGLVVVLGVAAIIIFLPTATVELRLRTAPLLVDEQLTIGTTADAGTATVPGTAFFREVSITNTAPVQNTEIVGEKATGTVEIVNRSVEVQSIKEQSRLVTGDGQLFYMQKHAIVQPNSRVTVAVEADLSGEEGNIEPQRLDFAALDEGSRQLVYAEAAKKFTGGSGEEISVVSENDLEEAQKAAGQQARAQAESEIRADLPEGWIILEESWTGEVISFDADAQAGDKTPQFGYKTQIAVRVMSFEQAALEEHLKKTLGERLDDDYILFPGPISYTKSVSEIDWDAARLTLAVRVTHTTIPNLLLDTMREKLAGRSTEEATEYLEGLTGVRSVGIELWPFWARSIPRIEQRISLKLEPEKQP
ncbi:MAG: baseplate J/gp47 family protein [bacterium]